MKESGIFFVRNGQNMTRIVHTNDLDKRMSEWQAASPSPIYVFAKITTASTRESVASYFRVRRDARTRTKIHMPYEQNPSEEFVFAELQRHFSGQRVYGDWFFIKEETLREMPLEYVLPDQPNVAHVRGASTVWPAVYYAHSKMRTISASKDCCRCLQTREALSEAKAYVIEWLTERGRNNIAIVLQFGEEMEMLENFARTANEYFANYSKDPYHFADCVTWMVLQGVEKFMSYMANPAPLNTTEFSCEHEAFFVYGALNNIIVDGAWDGGEYYECFETLMLAGARPDDFMGWDAKRIIAEFETQDECEAA